MDYRKDYIMRMIHMVGDLMRRLFERMDDQERRRLLSQACLEHCGMSLSAGETLETESLLEMLAPIPRLMMSELLFAKAETCELPVGDGDLLRRKALNLLASLYDQPQLCDLRTQRLIDLKAGLLPALTAPELMDCARFFAQAERYDEMEDALYQALERETGAERERDRARAAALLRAAARASEHTLALCRMTSRELRESARELEGEAADNTHEQE
ncbi:MAG: hypothetical protein GX418_15945 [Clostridiales bacterium]|nr:hypothetical protein [Clostridiales bacterium]